MQELRVPLAQKMEVTLSDNSKITLDAGSLLRYPDRFQEDSRQVYLEGEAYFEIASNPRKPFMVKTGNAVITVLGTKFNVRSWPNHVSKIAVMVTEGEVSFRNARLDVPNSQVIISSGQYSMIQGNTRPSAPKTVGMENPLSWLKHEKYFQNAPLQEVLDQLERWYDLQIILEDKILASSRVTIFIEDKPIEEVMEVISLMNHLQTRREGRKVILSAKE
jgi:ferric-dicitrate binding protein FerR (iron transport regulator)